MARSHFFNCFLYLSLCVVDSFTLAEMVNLKALRGMLHVPTTPHPPKPLIGVEKTMVPEVHPREGEESCLKKRSKLRVPKISKHTTAREATIEIRELKEGPDLATIVVAEQHVVDLQAKVERLKVELTELDRQYEEL
ncbi:hypothetical protein BHE74_00024258 [Ensete ventricosum]|nr:hypothetical protein GW17_00014980 [Ensete ventricosum]RWW68233.1 hypothetical protein BHE74_00024258 [Ensete ventricosum]